MNNLIIDNVEDFPDPKTNLLNIPLYKSFKINKDNFEEILRLEFYSKTIDCFCHECKKESTFKRINIYFPQLNNHSTGNHDFDVYDAIEKDQKPPSQLGFYFPNVQVPYTNMPVEYYSLRNHSFSVEFQCTRCNSKNLIFIYKVENSKLIKIGQYPSISDLDKKAISKYDKILGTEKSSELKKAIRLFSNGLGIASFVYLRRVLEHVIDKFHDEAKEQSDWDEDKYNSSRMTEKIKLLEKCLPKFFVENNKIYSVLSKGLHELREEECLSYFNSLITIIELILDNVISKKKKI